MSGINTSIAERPIPPKTIYLHQYKKPDYMVKSLHLDVDIQVDYVCITALSTFKKNTTHQVTELILNGSELELLELTINDQTVPESSYRQDDQSLVITLGDLNVSDEFILKVRTKLDPYSNNALEGLYESNGMLCTQCEAEGFRRMTFYLDRPDNMAVFTTRIEADKAQYPVLLSNGNQLQAQDEHNGRHSVVWHDPHPKPSYLFALVAGDLAATHDQFITKSGRQVQIVFYTEACDQAKVPFAISALKKAMTWDEQRYGREYDLDIFMVVAVSHFNMGAMENKGLNIFNTRCVLASPDTTTDQQYASVESIIAHEYFHNWSGNRVTCRDWFQLSLKEGFTVFRDQQFSMEVDSWLEHRLGAVKVMRSAQFAEDAGPMAHPVRPQDYIEINNFYTLTVYDKGAEVVRMIHTLLGDQQFRQGTDRYFSRFDGQAVTTEDFVNSVTENTDFDVALFQRWYDQPGTPQVTLNRFYDADDKTLTLRFEQAYPDLPNWSTPRLPVLIPIELGLIANGQPVNLCSDHGQFKLKGKSKTNGVFVLTQAVDELVFTQVPANAVPSLLRGFSAPVRLQSQLSQQELAALVAADEDMFNRWDSVQQMMSYVILTDASAHELLITTLGQILQEPSLEPATKAVLCQLPSFAELEQQQASSDQVVQVDQLLNGRDGLRQAIAESLRPVLLSQIELVNQQLAAQDYAPHAEHRGLRALRSLAMYYLVSIKSQEIEQQLQSQYHQADNLTDRLASLRLLVHGQFASATQCLEAFYQAYHAESLAMNAWFEVQASNPADTCLDQVRQLQQHPAFDTKSPNNVRALVGTFCRGNPRQFHAIDGRGYAFLTEIILAYNQTNPQLAARLVSPFIGWRQYDATRQQLMTNALNTLAASSLAPDVFEVVSKTLGRGNTSGL